ncbi:hypothetical protein L7F22_031412 [Adiantum nelumboides]|nr:hypothetical protein [Adiantum nelumboides]
MEEANPIERLRAKFVSWGYDVNRRMADLINEVSGEDQFYGNTVLHLAARDGDAGVVELLIKSGDADILAQNNDGRTPLHLAALLGHEAVLKKLLQHEGATSALMLQDNYGDTPLHHAALSGNENIIRQLLSGAVNPQDCVSARNKLDLRTPLHYAAGSKKPKAVALLLEYVIREHQQALKDQVDKSGALPFHFAARRGDVESMELLAPTDVNVECEGGLTALHYAAWMGEVEVVKHLLEKGATLKENTVTPLHLAAISEKPERGTVAEAILTKFPDSWKMANDKGELAIGLALTYDHVDVMRAVLRALQKWKPEPSYDILTPIKNKTYYATLLHYVARHGTEDDIMWLGKALEKDKTVNDIVDEFLRTPLHWAAMKGNTTTLKALVILVANLTQVAHRGALYQTPLFVALEAGHLNFAEELLKCDTESFKAGFTQKLRTTAEWMQGVDLWCKWYYHAKVAKQTKDELEREFRCHIKDEIKVTWLQTWLPTSCNGPAILDVYQEIPPVYLALHAGRDDIAKFFQQLSRRDENAVNKYAVNKKGPNTGRTALHWAVLFRRQDIVEKLLSDIEFKEVRLCEEDARWMSPVQYATEGNMQGIEFMLNEREAVKDYIAGLYRDRQYYVDTTNAILVGAALIASVTFGAWLQPPLGFTDDHYDAKLLYVNMRQVKGMRVFWIFNALSFFAAIGTVQAGACGVLPLRHVHIGRGVSYVRRALMVASLLMALSVVCVLGAFGAAGFIVLPPEFQFQSYMMATVIFGGLINASLICWFLQRNFGAPSWLLRVWSWRHKRAPASLPAPDVRVPRHSDQKASLDDPLDDIFPSTPAPPPASLPGLSLDLFDVRIENREYYLPKFLAS